MAVIEGLQNVIDAISGDVTKVYGEAVGAKETIERHAADAANPHSVTAAQAGLGNVDNTADADKPVSTAQAAAIAAAVAQEASDRDSAISVAIDSAVEPDGVIGEVISAAIGQEATDRDTAVSAEAEARAEAIETAVSAEAEARDEAIAQAKLAGQIWLPAVNTKAEIPSPATLNSKFNYLCRVINDTATPANNGVWQLIAGAGEWTYFSNNLDFVDETELAEAVEQEASDRDAAITAAVNTTLTDAAESSSLPATTASTFAALFQTVRNFLKYVLNKGLFKSATAGFMKNDGSVGYPTKSDVGLGNVDNTADTAKPVSTAQAAAIAAAVNGIDGLGGKLNISGGTMEGLLMAMAAPNTTAQVRNISIGTTLLTPGVSPLATGEIYICYE